MTIEIDLNGQIALVTGGSGLLGRVLVRTLARSGADVAIHTFQNKKMAATLEKEVAAMGRRALVVQADVTQYNQVLNMRDRIAKELGSPSLVIANAVTNTFPWKPILEEDPKNFEAQFQTSVMQSVYLAKAFLPAMIKQKSGRFIGINTESSVRLVSPQAAYAAAKRGMDGVLRILAKEAGEHQITVNQVAPGWLITDQQRKHGEEKNPTYLNEIPLKHRSTDQDVANAVAFLASDLASSITGAFLPVCGGTVMTGS